MVWPQRGPWLPGYIPESPGWQGRSGGLRHQRGEEPTVMDLSYTHLQLFRGKSGKLSQALPKHKSSLFLLFNHFVVIVFFLFVSFLVFSFLCYLSHADGSSNARGLNIWFEAQTFPPLFFPPPYHPLLLLHTYAKATRSLSVNCKKHKQQIEYQNQTQCLPQQHHGNFLLLYFWQAEYPGGEMWKFPFGRELTTCCRLSERFGRCHCKQPEMSGNTVCEQFLEWAAPKWHCLWCAAQVRILNHYETYPVTCTVHKPIHPHKWHDWMYAVKLYLCNR